MCPSRRRSAVAERLGDGRCLCLARSGAGIAHAQHALLAVAARGRNDDLAAGSGELDRVSQKVEHDLAHGPFIGHDAREPRRQRAANDDTRAIGLRLHDADALLGEFVQIEFDKVQVELTALDFGEVEQDR